MRNKLLAKNTVASLIAQITTLICGFILPRLFLQHFGSEVNGLVNSIVQFLSVISFLELGVGAVVDRTTRLHLQLAHKAVVGILLDGKEHRAVYPLDGRNLCRRPFTVVDVLGNGLLEGGKHLLICALYLVAVHLDTAVQFLGYRQEGTKEKQHIQEISFHILIV